MPKRLLDKIAIVTGASSGIGRSIARHFAAEGCTVACVDRDPRSRNPTEAEIPTHELLSRKGRASFLEADLSQPSQIQDIVTETVARYGRLDIMVNNAGVGIEAKDPRPIWDTPDSTYDKTMDVNAKAVWLGCKYAALQMKTQPFRPYHVDALDSGELDPADEGERGSIINTTSILGLVAAVNNSSYCTSKGAVVNLTRAAALDCAPIGVRVNAVAPGYTASSMTAPLFGQENVREGLAEKHPLRGLGLPRDLARACVFLASGESGWITGTTLPVEGGFLAR